MRILIETKNLIDFPYSSDFKSVFHFDNEKVDGLACEILYGWPTCYLVSGYRGAGKTSFMKKVEEKCNEQNAKDEKAQNLLFVYSNFSRFDTRTNFLRKIIRDLEETVVGIKNADKSLVKEVDALRKQTFYAVKEEHIKSEETEATTQFDVNVNSFLLKIVKALSPLVLTPVIGPILSMFKNFQFVENYGAFINIMVVIALVGIAFFGTLKVTSTYKVKVSEKTSNSESSLTDDDIINYYLERLITKFSEAGYRLIFVLDELDKMEDKEMTDLLKEMKPWLVRGKSDFIIVAGQKLTMKYYQLRDGDDELLASLFSKVVHVNLLGEYQFEKIFNDQLFKGIALNNTDAIERKSFAELTGDPSIKVSNFRDHYIYRSKKLPRTFMNLIRQDLRWNGKDAFLVASNDDYDCDKKKWSILKDIFEKIGFNASISETARDYIMMYLYRISAAVNCSGGVSIVPNVPEDYPFLKDQLTNYGNDFIDRVNEVLSKKAEKEKANENGNGNENENATPPVTEQIHTTEIAATIENITRPAPEKDIKSFTKDFLAFFNELSRFYTDLLNQRAESINRVQLQFLIDAYKRAKIFLFPVVDEPILNQSYDYFYKRQNDGETFSSLYNIFTTNFIRINLLREAVYKEYCSRMIQKYFKGDFQGPDAIPPSMREFGQFSVKIKDEVFDTATVLFRYQFIDGPIAVSTEDAQRLISYLDEFNLNSNWGNYIVQILISTESNDFEKEEVKAVSKIKSIRPIFVDRIRFILLPVNWVDKLEERLTKLNGVLSPYKLGPILKEDPARRKQRSKKIPASGSSKPEIASSSAIDPEDIQKGRWGGKSENNDRKLFATVVATSDKKWFKATITVISTDASNPLTGKVTFHLHDSFDPSEVTVIAKDNRAEIKDLDCYEAFTVGASCDNNTTHLELDLNGLDDAPEGFKYL